MFDWYIFGVKRHSLPQAIGGTGCLGIPDILELDGSHPEKNLRQENLKYVSP